MLSHRWIWVVLGAYAMGFALWPPRLFLIVDESDYVNQALAFARGALTVPGGVIYPAGHVGVMSDYPPGTALLQAPFVAAFGWQGAYVLPTLGLLLATYFTWRLLRTLGLRSEFALLVPAYAGSLYFGRAATSDVPSAAIVALGLWLLAGADRGGWGGARWFAAGAVIGASILVRELNIVLLAPFAVGAMVRRRSVSWALVAGIAVGIAARLALSQAMFGSALYLRDPGYGFSLDGARTRLGTVALLTLVVCPFAGVLPLLYRGWLRAEAIVATASYLAILVFYEYDSVQESGRIKGLILASRFLVPLIPLTGMMAADVFPRGYAALSVRGRTATRWLVRSWATAVVVLAFALHAAVSRETNVAASIVQAIQSHTSYDIPLITNPMTSMKYVSPAYGARQLILRNAIDSMSPAEIGRRFGRASVVLLDRNDAERFVADALANERTLANLAQHCLLRRVLDRRVASWAHLRIFEISHCGA
ncbi:MAG TPA: hypothetical protein VFT29_17495 [Gemmatimonadaceae bacterium]|nr:hypothetical protein [Gemmatimonadaceae bacterium]